jgi:hypothetical protein
MQHNRTNHYTMALSAKFSSYAEYTASDAKIPVDNKLKSLSKEAVVPPCKHSVRGTATCTSRSLECQPQSAAKPGADAGRKQNDTSKFRCHDGQLFSVIS